MTKMAGWWVGAAVALAVSGLAHQQQDGQPRNPASPATARLSGRVTTDDPQPAAIRGALVSVADQAGRTRSVATDEAGAFVFEALPAERYVVAASKRAFVGMRYGATRFDGPGAAVALAQGERVSDLLIRLPRGAVVTGVLRDADGQVLPDADVTAIRLSRGGAEASTVSFDCQSDDRGVYRLYGLPPGPYVVVARMRTAPSGEICAPSTAELDRIIAGIQQTQAVGSTVTSVTTPAPSQCAQPLVAAPTFFPGTAIAGDAQTLALTAGEVRTADFSALLVPTGSVDGVVRMHDGSATPPVRLALLPLAPRVPRAFLASPVLTVPPGRDGRFTFAGVLPGRYTLTLAGPLQRPIASGPPVWARTEVVTNGQDVGGVQLVLRPGLRVSGRVEFAGVNQPPPPTTIQIVLTPATGRSTGFKAYASVGADGTFVIPDLPPDSYAVSADGGPVWWLRSATVGGRDVLDRPLDVGDSDIEGAVLTFSDRHTELVGTIRTASGAPVSGYLVVLFPTEASLWVSGGRRIRSAALASDGFYRFRDLPGGPYYLAATTDIDQVDLGDPSILAQLVSAAVVVTLHEGASTTQDLRIGRSRSVPTRMPTRGDRSRPGGRRP